ncbi:MAG TPA: hypothetical protein VEZ72_07405 [Paenibacillus sp.]|nr:hypothetical protein [Paenibacillus sp.]
MRIRIFASIAVAAAGAALGYIVGWLAAANWGGNEYENFVFNGLRGYEAFGQIGGIAGAAIGAALGIWLARRGFPNKKKGSR